MWGLAGGGRASHDAAAVSPCWWRGPTRGAWRAWLAVSPRPPLLVARRFGATPPFYAAPRCAGAAAPAAGHPPSSACGWGGWFVPGCAYSRRGLLLIQSGGGCPGLGGGRNSGRPSSGLIRTCQGVWWMVRWWWPHSRTMLGRLVSPP